MTFRPTPEQQRIFKFIQKRPENIHIEAYAGAGKTTTIVEAVKLLPSNKNIMFLAFNKHIQEELKTRLPDYVRCYTSHGLGMSAIKRKYGDKIKFDEFKVDKHLQKYGKKWNLDIEFKSYEEKHRYLMNMKKMVNLCRLSLTLDKKWIPYIAERYDIPLNKNKDISRIIKLLDSVTQDRKLFDYTDMIYLPAVDNSLWLFPQDYILVDECQDINRAQQRLIEKMLRIDKVTKKYTGRLISIGDGFQCQPEGTEILMCDGTKKKIEDIQVGDIVFSYDKSKGGFIGNYVNHLNKDSHHFEYQKTKVPTVTTIEIRKISEQLIVVESNNKISKYTHNHRCMVSLRKDRIKRYVLYLMEKEGWFRIGIAPLWSSFGNKFISFRAKQENATKLWILKSFENKFDAYLEEQYCSTVFGIPQLRFFDRQNSGNFNQKNVNDFYSRFTNAQMLKNSLKILDYFNRSYKYPIWDREFGTHFSKNHMFELHACNIMPELMNMVHFDENNKRIRTYGGKKSHEIIKPTYKPITSLNYEKYNGYVYSMNVSNYGLYVADGILTHNSIYGFTGITDRTYQWFRNFKNTKILPLSYSFRCSKKVIEHAQKIVPNIKALPDAPEGSVRNGDVLKEAQDGDFILCRTTAPLIKLFFEFLSKQKKAVIKGSDIGLELIELINDFKDIPDLTNYWNNEIKKYRKKLLDEGIINPEEHTGYVALEDKVNTLLFLSRVSDSIEGLKHNIKTIFTDKLTGIVLSTIHKAKGLEANRVFIIRPDLIPLPNSRKWEYVQEKNLEYVAITRAKNELIYDNNWTDEN